MSMTQKQQIEAAKYAYVQYITDSRLRVYTIQNGELMPLWPSDCHKGAKSAELLDDQIYTKNRRYPRFHFYVPGTGFSKSSTVTNTLKRINPNIIVEVLP